VAENVFVHLVKLNMLIKKITADKGNCTAMPPINMHYLIEVSSKFLVWGTLLGLVSAVFG
jgi:hypothetical protein